MGNMEDFASYSYSELEVADMLGITPETLRQRIYSGKNHPPYQCPSRGTYWFPKELFRDWAAKKVPIKYEASNAS